jgi:hypothetical protein
MGEGADQAEPLRDLRGREVRPRSARQRAKLDALGRSNPGRLLLLRQDPDGTVHFSLRFTLRRGRPQDPAAGSVGPGGELRWHRRS